MSQLADKIKAAGLKRVEAKVPEWKAVLGGAKVYVRELTGAERGGYEAELADPTKVDLGRIRMKLVADTLVDENGGQVFDSPDDVAGLAGSVVGRLSDLALNVSGFTDEALDDAVKN